MRRFAPLLVLFTLATLPLAAQTVIDPCANQPRVRAAVRRALTALGEADPAAQAALGGCARAVTCGAEPTDTSTTRRARCATRLVPEEWGFRVTVHPRAANGAPAELHVNIDSANDTAHQAVVSGNRWAVGQGVAIVGTTTHRRHTHGGEAARIAWASFHVWNDSGTSQPLGLLDGVFINNTLERPLTPLSSDVGSLPPGESELEVGFPVQEAYQSWNNHFAARVRLQVGSAVLMPQAEFAVTRVEPLRR